MGEIIAPSVSDDEDGGHKLKEYLEFKAFL